MDARLRCQRVLPSRRAVRLRIETRGEGRTCHAALSASELAAFASTACRTATCS
eukprot:SAG11_NODE_27229_length_335_cov_0.661017_2_plen_53_part_01